MRPDDRDPIAKVPPHHSRYVIGALCWILGLEWFIAQAIAQAAWTTPYSLTQNFVSDLGAATCGPSSLPSYHFYVCSPLHDVMNLSFIALGLLTLVGLVLLRPLWPSGCLAMAGLIVLVLYGVGKIVVGLAPEDVRPALHALGALGILWGNLGIVLLGLATWQTRRWTALMSITVGVVGTVAFILLVLSSRLHLEVGLVERVADYPLPVWLAVLGARVFGHRDAPDLSAHLPDSASP